ncbi:MAG: response regulator [Bacteroidales bacterium]|nr:response regulator [Bacteroidales bacterium]
MNRLYTWTNRLALVVEDDPLNYLYIELLLKKKTGIDVMWAKNGSQTIELFAKHKSIDIILLDLQLPDIDGFQVLKKIKEINPQIPISIQTAHTWNDEDRRSKSAGADGFFSKPLHADSLLRKMDAELNKYISYLSEITS